MTKLLNILIRTSNRPIGFRRMIDGIRRQSFKNIRIIVSVDNPESYKYVTEMGIDADDILIVQKFIPPKSIIRNRRIACYNSYFNDIIKEVKDGWVFFVDDDDVLIDDNVLQTIVDNCICEDTLYIYKMKINETIVPSHSWGIKPTLNDIGTPNFIFHSKYADKATWPPYTGADGDYVIEISKMVKNIRWVDKLIYLSTPSNGRPEQ